MKNLSVLLVFVFAVAGVLFTVSAQAHSEIRVAPALDCPVALEVEDGSDSTAIAGKKKKKKDKDDKKEEDEEEFRYSGSASLQALEMMDPGALDFVVRMNAAGLR
jgi:hypothetical protein